MRVNIFVYSNLDIIKRLKCNIIYGFPFRNRGVYNMCNSAKDLNDIIRTLRRTGKVNLFTNPVINNAIPCASFVLHADAKSENIKKCFYTRVCQMYFHFNLL